MRISQISYNIYKPVLGYNLRKDIQTVPNFKSENKDIVSFSGRVQMNTIERMTTYATELLKSNNLQKGQQVFIKGESQYLPFMELLSKEAYKLGSGLVLFNILEPEIEELKQKYNISEEFDYKKEQINFAKENNALFFEFDKLNNPYESAKISSEEVQQELKKLAPSIPQEIQDIFKVSPEEILKSALDIHKGQPIYIKGEREHLPLITKIVDYMYGENESKLVSVAIANNNYKNFLKYAKDDLLEYVPSYEVQMFKEFYEKDVAWLQLDGSDPKELEDVDTAKIIKNRQARSKAIEEYNNKTMSNVPWLVYYAPTTKSIKEVYTEFGDDTLGALKQAYEDANKINRLGKLQEHVEALDYRAQKMNELINDGYRTLHYVSVDDVTKQPDGKTDFKITMSPKSIFNACRMDMQKYGHKPIVNVPSEEVFTSPQADTAEGVVSATMPLSLNGQLVEGIRLTFREGKVIDIYADKNEDMLRKYITENRNADRLGEVALVAGSPIAAMGRLFNSTLLDENAACHLALGNAYPDCVSGVEEIEDYEAQKEYLANLKINSSPTHTDFMIGGKNVYIYAINNETNDVIEVIKNDEFLL